MLNVIVLIAMAVTAAAFAAGLIVQAGLPLVPSSIGTAALFLVMAASFFGIGRAKSGGGSDRVDEIEEALEIIDKDLQRLDRVEDGVSRIDGLSDRVEQLGEAVSGGAPGDAADGAAFAAKLKDVYARIEAVREDMATQSKTERDRVSGELGALEGMIKRVSGNFAAASASGAALAAASPSGLAQESPAAAAEPKAFVLEPEASPEIETVEEPEGAAEETLVLEVEPEPAMDEELPTPQPDDTGPQDAGPQEVLILGQEAHGESETARDGDDAEDAADREGMLLAAATLAEDATDREIAEPEAKGDQAEPDASTPDAAQSDASAPDDTGIGAAAAVIDDDDDAAMLDTIRTGIEQGRVDLYLQPTVTLPDRKVRYFESLTRIRKADDALVMPGDYMPVAKRSALMPLIDNVLVVRSVQVLRRLGPDTRIKGLFANISMHSLLDPDYFPELIEFMEENNGLSENLIFQISQSELQGLTESELSCLDTLGALGFKFCLGNVGDLDADFGTLSERYFRYAKVGAEAFLGGPGRNAADLKRRLDGLGMVLMIEKVEKESDVADLLDHGVEFAQGHLFAEARPMNTALSEELESAGAT